MSGELMNILTAGKNISVLSLPGRGETMIMKVVFPGWDLSIALQMCWPLQFPQEKKKEYFSTEYQENLE